MSVFGCPTRRNTSNADDEANAAVLLRRHDESRRAERESAVDRGVHVNANPFSARVLFDESLSK